MASIIGRQVQTYHDSIMAAHHQAMRVADLDEAMTVGGGLVATICARVKSISATGRPQLAEPALREWVALLLQVMPWVLVRARQFIADGDPISSDAVGAYEDAILSLREVLARVDDPTPLSAVRFPAAAELEPAVREPPQSWYDEDMGRLAVPR